MKKWGNRRGWGLYNVGDAIFGMYYKTLITTMSGTLFCKITFRQNSNRQPQSQEALRPIKESNNRLV